jgi:outer membrane protein assembly factor BamB
MSRQILEILCCLIVFAVLTAACQRNPEPSSVAATSAPTATTAASPTSGPTSVPGFRSPLWTFATQGEVWGSPAISDGVVFIGSDDHFLYAVDAATHSLKWKFETGDIVRSRPAVAGGKVYFTGDDGFLYAADAATGREIWRFDMGKPSSPRLPIPDGWDYMQSSPAVAGGVVFVGSGNANFYAVDAVHGKERWRFEVRQYVRSSPAVVDGVVYFGDWSGMFYALNALIGEEEWRFDTKGAVVPSPTVVDGVVYIGSKFPCLYALDAKTGAQKWCFAYPAGAAWVESSAAVAYGVVYVGSSDWFRVNAIDAVNGKLKWQFITKGDPWSSPAVSEGVVYIGSSGGFLYALDAATGVEQWKLKTEKALKTEDLMRIDGGVVSSPAIADGVVYFGSLDGKLYAVSTAP